MEPASLYLTCLVAIFGVWVAGESVWSFASWVTTRSWSGRSMQRIGAIGIGLLMAATAWRAAPASADVVPMRERAIAVGEALDADLAFTRYALPSDLASTPVSLSDSARTHTVVKGDCLWKIARSVLVSDGSKPTGVAVGRLWRQIYTENRTVVGDNPNLIFPGQVLVIPER